MNKQFFFNLLYICVGSTLIGFTYNTLSPDGIPFFATETTMVKTGIEAFIQQNPSTDNNIALEIDLKTAFEIHGEGLAVFVDGRDEWEFGDGRIAGAINIPEYNYEDHVDKYNKMDKSLNYIIYCGGDDCDISIRLAKKLKSAGFENVYVFSGGWDQWVAANFPVEHD